MLGVGVDWAESFHDVALGRPGQGMIEHFRIEHGPAAARLVAVPGTRSGRGAGGDRDPARPAGRGAGGCGVHGAADQSGPVARRHGPAEKKDDAEDARICCLLTLDAYLEMRKLIPHGEAGTELRAVARDEERAARDERRPGNRLRADLLAVFPDAIDIAVGDLRAAVFPKLLVRWPSANALARASREELEAFACSAWHGWPDWASDAMAVPRLAARPELARAKAGSIRLAAGQLLAIRAQRREWERRMAELLLGAPLTGRDHTPEDPDPGKAFPGSEIYLSMPGLGDRLAARVAHEIGEHFEQYATPNPLQCNAGRAAVIRRSGRSDLTVACRPARNRHLGEAVQQWAFCSLSWSTRAR